MSSSDPLEQLGLTDEDLKTQFNRCLEVHTNDGPNAVEDLGEDEVHPVVKTAYFQIMDEKIEQYENKNVAEEIAANTEYDDADAVFEDYPTEKALQAKRDQLAATGLTTNANESEDDLDGIPSGVYE